MNRALPLLFLILTLPSLTACGSFLRAIGSEPIEDDPGERTMGAQVEDESIETKAKVNIAAADAKLKAAHVVTVSYNGFVLIAGQVPDEAMKKKAAEVVREIRGVRRIYNELEIAGNTAGMVRSSDAWITTKVKSGLLANEKIQSGRVKVVTENGVVYLMGLATQAEAERAADVAADVDGVQRVVKLFEYID